MKLWKVWVELPQYNRNTRVYISALLWTSCGLCLDFLSWKPEIVTLSVGVDGVGDVATAGFLEVGAGVSTPGQGCPLNVPGVCGREGKF